MEGERKLISFAVLRVFNLKQLRYYGAAELLHGAAAGSNPINLGANERSPCSALLRLQSVITLNCFPFGPGLCGVNGLGSAPAENAPGARRWSGLMDETGAQLFPSHPFGVKLLVLQRGQRDLWMVSGRRTAGGWGGSESHLTQLLTLQRSICGLT